jgi:hypothetical protein
LESVSHDERSEARGLFRVIRHKAVDLAVAVALAVVLVVDTAVDLAVDLDLACNRRDTARATRMSHIRILEAASSHK